MAANLLLKYQIYIYIYIYGYELTSSKKKIKLLFIDEIFWVCVPFESAQAPYQGVARINHCLKIVSRMIFMLFFFVCN